MDVVVIGLNSERLLGDCLASVAASGDAGFVADVYYADGASTDSSRDIAAGLAAKVIEVVSESPSPGRQRNAGWRAGSAEFVQFLDSDTVMARGWLEQGLESFSGDVGAVFGDVRERHPERSVYNWIGDQEWNCRPGEAAAFGGIVLIRRKVLEATGGYDEELIAGEDPELAYRVRKAGFRLVKLEAPMVTHDLEMLRLGQYLRRAYRTGHGFAEVHARHPDFWRAETRRLCLRAGSFILGICLFSAAFLTPWMLAAPALGCGALLRPRLLHVGRLARERGLGRREARVYAWHASLVVLPQFFGVLRYWWGRISARPLTNRKRLVERAAQGTKRERGISREAGD